MKGSFGEILSSSLEWTKTMLFRPFKVKKWIFLYIIALLAFQMPGGNSGSNINLPTPETEQSAEAQEVAKFLMPGDSKSGLPSDVKGALRFLTPLYIFLGILGLILFLVFEWLRSIFSFIFIESIVNNDASIKAPFLRNRSIGNSYYGWNLAYLFVFFAIAALIAMLGFNSLRATGVFDNPNDVGIGAALLAILPHLLIFILLAIVSGLIFFFIWNYVLVVMYKDRLPILQALPIAFSLLRANQGASIKYLFIMIGLAILTAIINAIASFLIFLALIIPAGLIAAILYGIYKILPDLLKGFFAVLLVILGVPLLVIVALIVNAVFLPIPIFLKTFNLKFIARLDERYNLFKIETEGGQA